jgi:actin beta/gamma 1
MLEKGIQTLVIDNGSYLCKIGIAGDYEPSSVFPAVVGHVRQTVGYCSCFDGKYFYIGHEAQYKRGILNLYYPIQHGTVTNWEDLERIYHYEFYDDLRIAPEEHPILLTESSPKPKFYRQKMTTLMFETFNVPALYIQHQGVLSLYSTGRTTGVVAECGGGSTQILPIYEGFSLPYGTICFDVGGRDLTEYLLELLKLKGCCFNKLEYHLNEVKERFCYVAPNYESELKFVNILILNNL